MSNRMIAEIGYADGRYFVWVDGHCVAIAHTHHEADVIVQGLQEAEASWQMGGMSNVGQPTLRCGLPNPLYRVQQAERCAYRGCVQNRTHEDTGFCCYHNEEETGCRCDCEDDDWADAVWESEQGSYNNYVPQPERPLLAQCAEVIRACLGGPVATSGIVDELRRVERSLAKAGW